MAKNRPSFDEYYKILYPERWEGLKEAFSKDPIYTELKAGLLKPYYLDPASVRAAKCLDAASGNKILDLCAAPGGKSLVIALEMSAEAHLTVNDRSANRRSRLRKVLDEHLPSDIRSRITITGHDAAKWGMHHKNEYDRILLDAPCSSERHVMNSPAHMKKWSPARTKHLSIQAFAMLASAFDALTPGGRLVYSTCSISPLENENVVKKLLKKRAGAALITVPSEDNTEEKADPGYKLMPDKGCHWGPIYYAVIGKGTD